MLEIVSIHGQNRQVVKEFSLSLSQIIELRNLFQSVIDESPKLIATAFPHHP